MNCITIFNKINKLQSNFFLNEKKKKQFRSI